MALFIIPLFLWYGYLLSDTGYGFRTFIAGATGKWKPCKGTEMDGNWIAQKMARDYLREAYALPKPISWAFIPLTLISAFSAGGYLIFPEASGTAELDVELVCIGVMVVLAFLRKKAPRRTVLQRLTAPRGGIRPVWREVALIKIKRPQLWLDLTTLLPSWLLLTFLLASLTGGVLLGLSSHESFPDFQIPLLILAAANAFSLPVFFGFSLLGLFSWPLGAVSQDEYYPLLVLHRDLEKLSRG